MQRNLVSEQVHKTDEDWTKKDIGCKALIRQCPNEGTDGADPSQSLDRTIRKYDHQNTAPFILAGRDGLRENAAHEQRIDCQRSSVFQGSGRDVGGAWRLLM